MVRERKQNWGVKNKGSELRKGVKNTQKNHSWGEKNKGEN